MSSLHGIARSWHSGSFLVVGDVDAGAGCRRGTTTVSTGASVRKEIRIHRRADDVWARIEDPGCIQDWFPGIVASTVDDTTRVITLGSGIAMPEEIVTSDPIQHRFQYRITVPLFRNHLGSIDVIDLGDETTLVVYSTDADPRTMALVIGAATAAALIELRDQMEAGETDSNGKGT